MDERGPDISELESYIALSDSLLDLADDDHKDVITYAKEFLSRCLEDEIELAPLREKLLEARVAWNEVIAKARRSRADSEDDFLRQGRNRGLLKSVGYTALSILSLPFSPKKAIRLADLAKRHLEISKTYSRVENSKKRALEKIMKKEFEEAEYYDRAISVGLTEEEAMLAATDHVKFCYNLLDDYRRQYLPSDD